MNKEKEETNDEEIKGGSPLFPTNKTLIQNEKARMYEYPDKLLEIHEPVVFQAFPDGHFLVDYEGRGHFVASGWVRIIFVPKKGKYEIPAIEEKEEKDDN